MASAQPSRSTFRDMSANLCNKMINYVDALKGKRTIRGVKSTKACADAAQNDTTLLTQFESTKLEPSTNVASTRPSESTLQGIPPELRIKIYEHVSAAYNTRKRVILGWKFVKAHIDAGKESSTLRQQFESACISVPCPLSLICRLLRNEFPGLDPIIAAPAYDLMINNFDLEQIELFLKAIDECSINRRSVSLRFQIDRGVVQSSQALSDKLLAHRNDQKLRCTDDKFGDIYYAVLLRYRDGYGSLDPEKTPTKDQLKEAGRALTVFMVRCGLGRAPAPLGRWLLRFLKLGQFNVMLSDAQRAG